MAQFVFDPHFESHFSLIQIISREKLFQWDDGNLTKSKDKHGISKVECEEIFYDEDILLLGRQVAPVHQEIRYGVIGSTIEKKILFCSFTLRGSEYNIIRPISIRVASKKERAIYE